MMHESRLELLLSNRFSKVATADLRVARPAIEKLHGPFQAQRLSAQAQGEVDIRAALCGQVAVGTFSFGRTVDIVPNGLADAVIVTTATRGRAAIGIGGVDYRMHAGDTVIAHEEDHPVFRYEPDTEVLKLRFHRSRLEDFHARSAGTHAVGRERLRFATAMSDADAAVRWTALLGFLVTTINASVRRAPSLVELASMEEMLMLTLLNSQPNNYASAMRQLEHDEAAAPFGRAVAYIEQHLANEISLDDLADAACCSARTLARAFQRAGAAPPMQYVRNLRLERIRAELLSWAAQERKVADIAFAWGCRHLGEFNRQYRAAFGETPSQTRERAALPAA